MIENKSLNKLKKKLYKELKYAIWEYTKGHNTKPDKYNYYKGYAIGINNIIDRLDNIDKCIKFINNEINDLIKDDNVYNNGMINAYSKALILIGKYNK